MYCVDTYKDAQANLETATFTSDLDCSMNLSTAEPPSVMEPPVPPSEGQSLVAVSSLSSLQLDDEVRDVVLVEQKDKETQTEETCSGTAVLLGKITTLEAILKEHTEMLDLILSNLVHQSSETRMENNSTSAISDKFVFPLSTEQDLIELNQMLSDDKSGLKQFLIGTGGSTLNDAFQRTIQKILSDDLAVKFSLKGKRGKKPLNDLTSLVMALKECVRSYPSLSTMALSGQLDDKACDEAISGALKKSADRVFQRNRKAGEQVGRIDGNQPA